MNFNKLLKFLFPEYHIIAAFEKYGFISKRRQQTPVANHSTQTIRNSQGAAQQASGSPDRSPSVNNAASGANRTFSYPGMSVPKATSKVNSAGLNKKFDDIKVNLAGQIVGQSQCLANLLIAFKRPFVTGHNGSTPRNTLFLIGGESSCRHTMVRAIVRQLAEEKLINYDAVSTLDLALYTGASDERVFNQDLSNVLYSESDVVIVDNFDKCPNSYLLAINRLITQGRYRVTSAEGNLVTLSANRKYFVFITDVKESKIIETFGNKFMLPSAIS